MGIKKRTDAIWRMLIITLCASIALMLGMWIREWWLSRKAEYVRYDEFGIDIPTNYSVHGIDVSKYQHIIDWDRVKAMSVDNVSISFTFIKATEGNINEDKYFIRNWKRAKRANLTRGA